MLIGLAVGDALGAPVEFGYTAADIQREWDGKMHDHRLPAGYWTDDMSMALCLADSLLECGGYDSFDVMEKYRRWMTEGYRDSENSPAPDIGSQTREAIERFMSDSTIYRDEPRGFGAGNGGIMRLAPSVIAVANQPIETAIHLAKVSSRETHYSEEADAGAEVFAAMLWSALHSDNKAKIIDVAAYSRGEIYDDILLQIRQSLSKDSQSKLQDLGGYVVDALKIAAWGLMNFETFEEGLVEVIKLGGDTDTNGAIYGQLAGAFYGVEAVPERWLGELHEREDILRIASDLYSKQPFKIIATRFEEDEL